MKIYSVYDKEFAQYGQVINDNFDDIYEALEKITCPEGIIYEASVKLLEDCPSFNKIQDDYFGGMPIQIGHCSGHNSILAAIEYHKCSEINMANEEFILLIGKREDIVDNTYDLSKIEAFKVPAKVAVEVYSSTLHYCPCGVDGNGFRMLVVLPKGTNVGDKKSELEPLLRNTNKWLLAHKDSGEAKSGAYIGLVGDIVKL